MSNRSLITINHAGDCTKSKRRNCLSNKTDTIVYSHVNFDFLPITICHSVDIDLIACVAAQRPIYVDGGGGWRYAGFVKRFSLAAANSF